MSVVYLKLSPAQLKRFAELQARAAMAGYEVNRILDAETGRVTYLCKRWSLLRELDTLDEVAAWLHRAGVEVPA